MKFLISERLSQHKYKTPEGYLVCVDSILARTGKQTYRKSEIFKDCNDESEIEVERSANEVFSDKALASFENKPITVEHPYEDVNVDNYSQHSVGFVRDVHRGVADGQDVMLGTLVITDAKTIEEIENGEHTDLSCGYDCDIKDEANPQQRNIRGNHVALCQQGRAGIARIVDSKDAEITNESGNDKIIYVMQSNADKDLYFYIGKTYSMKEGDWSYQKVKMGSTTPEQLKKELEQNGWHQVANGPAKIIDNNLLKNTDDCKTADELIQSSSKEALKKNIETEIKSGKDPKQAAAIAYSVQRQNDASMMTVNGENVIVVNHPDDIPEKTRFSKDENIDGQQYIVVKGQTTNRTYYIRDSLKKFEVSYEDNDETVIEIVKAKSLEDAIKKTIK